MGAASGDLAGFHLDLGQSQACLKLIANETVLRRFGEGSLEALLGFGRFAQSGADAGGDNRHLEADAAVLTLGHKPRHAGALSLRIRRFPHFKKSAGKNGLCRDFIVYRLFLLELCNGLPDRHCGLWWMPFFDGQLGKCHQSSGGLSVVSDLILDIQRLLKLPPRPGQVPLETMPDTDVFKVQAQMVF